MKSFELKTSLIKRLQKTMVIVAIFSVLIFFGIYLSSLTLVNGLTSINTANSIFSLTSQTLQAMEDSEKNLEKVIRVKKITDIEYSFDISQSIVNLSIAKAIRLSRNIPPIHDRLVSSQDSIRLYERGVRDLFKKISSDSRQMNVEEISAEVLANQQFIMEAKDGLRKTQIELNQRTDKIFSTIYANRFYPLIVATILSLVFFSFVVTVGFSISRKFRRSILNLTKATEIVGEGDLNYSAVVLEEDEIGNLTHAFNIMVNYLRDEKIQRTLTLERIHRLQEITASFSEALTVDQVCEVTVKTACESLGASSGTIAIIKNNNELVIYRSEGILSDLTREGRVISLNDPSPFAETIRYSDPIFIGGQTELISKYPELVTEDVKKYDLHAWAFVPLEVASQKIGSLGFYFKENKTFTKSECEFIMAMGRQCAQAIHRSDLYDEARDAIAARDEFLSIASHELRTPLTSLKLQYQMLLRRLKKGKVISYEKLLESVEGADKHIERLTRLIEDLLDVSRISTGRLTLNFGKYNLSDMIRDIISQYRFQLKDASNQVEVLGDTDINCECDLIRMEQVLINLLTNATKYAPGKPIQIYIEKHNGLARISVKDRGPGIAPRDQSRIFERFERIRGTENVGGLGLGLYISKQIIRAHKGDIWVESGSEKGSTFIIEVPLIAIKEDQAQPQNHQQSGLSIPGIMF